MTVEIEIANAYRDMMKSDGWVFFQKFLEGERTQALEQSVHSDEIKDIQVFRGKVKAFNAIQAHLGYILNEHT